MHVSALSRRCRDIADLLEADLDRREPGFAAAVAAGGNLRELLPERLGISVTVAEASASGCSVAGSSSGNAITVVRASPARMRFTALHELAHILAEASDDVQDQIWHLGATRSRRSAQSARDLEEDVCDAFAAGLLLPDERVEALLGSAGRTARGLHALVTGTAASREACAVALAQRLEAPGYAGVAYSDGRVSFVARSGDVLPVARGADQRGGVLGPLVAGVAALTEQGALLFASGAPTDELYIDARRIEDRIYFVATTDRADWEAVSTRGADEPGRHERFVTGYCEICSEDFEVPSPCKACGEPRHLACGGCGCDSPPAAGARICQGDCRLELPAPAFEAGSDICQECA